MKPQSGKKKFIRYTFWTKQRFEDGDSVLDLNEIQRDYDRRTFQLEYTPWSTVVGVALLRDNQLLKTINVQKDPETNMPFEL